MADDSATRVRRHRAHLAGDHSSCRHSQAAEPFSGRPRRHLDVAPTPGQLVEALVELAAPLQGPGDRALAAMGLRLASAFEQTDDVRELALLGGQLRVIVKVLLARVGEAASRPGEGRPNRLQQMRERRAREDRSRGLL